MAPYPRESNSSGATTTMIAVVVITVLCLGMLAMVGLALFFFFSVYDTDVQVVEVPSVDQETVEVLTEDKRLDQQPSIPPPESVEPELSEVTSLSETNESADDALTSDLDETLDRRDGTDAEDPEVPSTVETPQKRLTDVKPLETLDVLLGDDQLVRSVQIDGQVYPTALWAQPTTNLGSCQISFPLQKAYQRLTGLAAIADAADEGSAEPAGTFRVYGDGNLLWDSGLLEGYGSSSRLDIDVQGIRLVVLVVESNSPSDISLFNWADLRLAPI
jgi:hypothetical protein